jgi:diguanylate cyclase
MSLSQSRQARVLELINTSDVLQTTTAIPMRVLQLRRSRSATIQDFSDAVAADTCLCSKVLALANSAWFSPKSPITRVSTAISMVGLNNLLPMLFGLSLAGIFSKLSLPPSEAKDLWKSSLLKAIAARELVLRRQGKYAEEAFICAMMQDIALPVMYAADRSAWPMMCAAVDLEHAARLEHERGLFGSDHMRFGQLLSQRLGMPQLYVVATASHHDPTTLSKVVRDPLLADALSFAAALPHRMSDWNRVRVENLHRPVQAAAAPVPEDQLNELLQDINHKYQEMLAMMRECEDDTAAFRSFLQELSGEIASCLASNIGTSSETISRLQRQEMEMSQRMKSLEKLAIQSDYDSLTSVLNRRGFLSGTRRVFQMASDFRYGCAIGFLDIDNFKQVNDMRGHAAGDTLLAAVAARLREAIGERGAVGRFGGDEFVFVTVAFNEEAAQATARQIDRAVQNLEVEIEPGQPRVTINASIGLLWLGVPDGCTPEQALKEADRLMYAAKQAGKRQMVFQQLQAIPA